MSDIRFIRQQGDLLDAAIAQAPAPKPATLFTRIRSIIQPHKRIAAVVVALVVAGCATVAATNLSGSTQRLALGRVNCYYGTKLEKPWTPHSDVVNIGATLVGGETPQSWCRHEFSSFSSYSPHELREMGLTPVHDPKLIACVKSSTTIAVLIASGNANQCQHLGLTPLPKTIKAAFASVHALSTALRSLHSSRNCWSASAFMKAVRTILVRHGFVGWRIIQLRRGGDVDVLPAGTGGDCAEFVGNQYGSLDGLNRTFSVILGMSHSDYELWNRLGNKLRAETWARCYTPAQARTLVDRTFAGTGLVPRIAVTAPINRGFRFSVLPRWVRHPPRGFNAAQRAKERHFRSGCAIQPMLWIATNDRFVDVWLTARHGRFIKFGTYPPPTSYFHS